MFNVFDRCPRIRMPSVLHSSGASISIYTFGVTIGACRCHRLDDTFTSDASAFLFFIIDYFRTPVRVFDPSSCSKTQFVLYNTKHVRVILNICSVVYMNIHKNMCVYVCVTVPTFIRLYVYTYVYSKLLENILKTHK